MASEYDVLVTDRPTQTLRKQLTPFFHKMEDVPLFAYPEWDDIIRHYTKRPVFRIIVRKDGDIVATAALTLILSPIFKNRLVSSGFFTGSNLLYTDEKAVAYLIEKAEEIAVQNDLGFVEFKAANVKEHSRYVTVCDNIYNDFTRELEDTPEAILLSVKRKKRADLRKALANEALEFSNDIAFDDFYHIYTLSQRNLGTPVHSKAFYKAISQLSAAQICGVLYKNKVIAACMYFESGTVCTAYYGGASGEARHTHAYDLMYYKLMCLAAENGRTIFDFGRSKGNTGAFNYKKFWGFEPKPIPHSYLTIHDETIPNNTPLNPKFQRHIQIWKMLPLWLANNMGPVIMRHLG